MALNRPFKVRTEADTDRNFNQVYNQLVEAFRLINLNTANTDDATNNSLSGTLIMDDGSNWRVTLKFYHGRLVGVEIASSSSATVSWT